MRPSDPDPKSDCGDNRDVTGVDIAWRSLTPLVRVSRWRCHERTHGLTAERQGRVVPVGTRVERLLPRVSVRRRTFRRGPDPGHRVRGVIGA